MENNWITKYKYAHRGLHNDKYPENSLGAFQNAINYKFAIELDVRLTKDGDLAVLHDANLLRMCGVDINISDIPTSELKNYKLNDTEYTIPTLQEVFDLVQGKVPLLIELKPLKMKDHLSEKVYSAIKAYDGKVAVKSFNHLEMIWFKKHANEILRGMLGSGNFKEEQAPWLYKLVIKRLSLYHLVKPHFISYDNRSLPIKFVTNKKCDKMAWTIRSKEEEKQARQYTDTVVFENYIPEK